MLRIGRLPDRIGEHFLQRRTTSPFLNLSCLTSPTCFSLRAPLHWFLQRGGGSQGRAGDDAAPLSTLWEVSQRGSHGGSREMCLGSSVWAQPWKRKAVFQPYWRTGGEGPGGGGECSGLSLLTKHHRIGVANVFINFSSKHGRENLTVSIWMGHYATFWNSTQQTFLSPQQDCHTCTYGL